MALLKQMNDDRGVSVSYHKIAGTVVNHVNGTVEVFVNSYFNKDIRDANVDNFIIQRKYTLEANTDALSREVLYLSLLNHETQDFDGAVSC